jgi:hypothetical protein
MTDLYLRNRGRVPVLDTQVSGKSLHADPRVITYGKKSIALEEVEWVSYWVTHTATRHYFSPTTHDSEWGFKVGRYAHFGGPKIAVRYDSVGRQHHAPDSWMFLANLSRQYLEPRLLADFVNRVRRGETVAVGGGVKVSQDGIACPKPRLSLPWHLIGRIQSYNGMVWIYQAGAEEPAVTVPLSHPNAGLISALVATLTS